MEDYKGLNISEDLRRYCKVVKALNTRLNRIMNSENYIEAALLSVGAHLKIYKFGKSMTERNPDYSELIKILDKRIDEAFNRRIFGN